LGWRRTTASWTETKESHSSRRRYFPKINGYEIHARQPEIIALMLSVAAGEVDEAFIGKWINRHLRKLKRSRRPGQQLNDAQGRQGKVNLVYGNGADFAARTGG
jgi:hypothetical protein